MPSPINVLVLIHGITPEPRPSARDQYQPFLAGLEREWRRPLRQVMQEVVEVTWGTDAGGTPRPDQYLAAAERFISSRVAYDAVRADRSPENEVLAGFHSDFGIPLARRLFTALREKLVQFGLADAIYYASAEGEVAVRNAIYGQVLERLEPHRDEEVRLHIVGHSLGVTVAHDFLFGLFGPKPIPDYATEGAEATRKLYVEWRERAHKKQLRFGTFISLASQLPLFVLRKQALVQRLADKQLLDPAVIGIDPARSGTQWAIFYDIDDVLGFATRRLYQSLHCVRDIQVRTGWEPLGAHLGYWKSDAIVSRSAAILAANAA